jgi:hypothetical protein
MAWGHGHSRARSRARARHRTQMACSSCSSSAPLSKARLAWGERFHVQSFVSRPAMKLIAERGGRVSHVGSG